jgi:hypothetical protein
MKPITYWLQNEAINQLVKKYGAHLEKLSAEDRRCLIRTLTIDTYWCCDHTRLDWLEPLLYPLTRYEKDLLIEAIAATLVHHGNPWLENARATVAIAQKEGTPSH